MAVSFKKTIKSADKGDLASIIEVANAYFEGNSSVKQDKVSAMKYFKMGAEQGDANCQSMANRLENEGYGMIDQVKPLTKSAKKGDISAIHKIAEFYLYGKGCVKQNEKLAFKLFSIGQKKNDEYCISKLGECYLNGKGVKANKYKAFELFTDLNQKGNLDGKLMLANCYRYGEGTEKAISETFRLAKEAESTGDVRVFKLLAECYYNGIGTPIDYELAFEYYEKGASMGDDDCRYCLGYCYATGNGVERDDFYAGRSFAGIVAGEVSAENYYGYANSYLGYCYLKGKEMHTGSGKTFTANYDKAYYRFEKAANSGNLYAEYCRGIMLEKGWGKEKNEQAAFEIYMDLYKNHEYLPAILRLIEIFYLGEFEKTPDQKAVRKLTEIANQKNCGTTQCYTGYFDRIGYGVPKNDDKAFEKMQSAYNNGSVDGTYFLGLFYKLGIGCEKDNFKAVELLKKASEQGSAIAKYTLGVMYDNGDEGVTRNLNLALSYYQQAHEDNCLLATNALANIYLKGKYNEKGDQIVRIDYKKAIEYYNSLVNNGSVKGYYGLAMCYDLGLGIEKNIPLAIEYYKTSSEAGVGEASKYLGYCYEKGHGVDKNYKTSYEYYNIASNQGNKSAIYKVAHCIEVGYGCKADLNLAMNKYDDAVIAGVEKAKLDYARLAVLTKQSSNKVYDKVVNYLKDSISAGYSEAYGYLARYLYISNPKKEKDNILEMLKKGVKESASSAYYLEGEFYLKGLFGYEKDLQKSTQCYINSANLGSIEACDVLINAYHKGKLGLPKSKEDAFKYELKAASYGDSTKFFEVANAFLYGNFRAKDIQEAVYWLGKCVILSRDKKEAKKANKILNNFYFDDNEGIWKEGKAVKVKQPKVKADNKSNKVDVVEVKQEIQTDIEKIDELTNEG